MGLKICYASFNKILLTRLEVLEVFKGIQGGIRGCIMKGGGRNGNCRGFEDFAAIL